MMHRVSTSQKRPAPCRQVDKFTGQHTGKIVPVFTSTPYKDKKKLSLLLENRTLAVTLQPTFEPLTPKT